MARRNNQPSEESNKTRYFARAIKRILRVTFWLFMLFLLIMFIVWAVPKVWNWALG
ncbi:MAG: hypothetical protein Q7R87_02130 [Nanoarchaeota archaeon]|nr:hypothetical protein [Nanoarchaeota archaeon]